MSNKFFALVLLLSLMVVLVGTAVADSPTLSPIRPITVEIDEVNAPLLVRCVTSNLDEVIITPIGDREVTVECRVYVGSAEGE